MPGDVPFVLVVLGWGNQERPGSSARSLGALASRNNGFAAVDTRAATLAAVTASFAQMGTPRGTYTIAIGLTGDPVPVGSRSGAIMHRNDQRPISAHTCLSSVNCR